MTGKKRRALRRVEETAGGFRDLRFRAADVGDQMLAAEHAGELLHEVENRVDGRGQHDDLALARRLQGVRGNGVYGMGGQRRLRSLRAPVPADNRAAKARRAQRQTNRRAQKSRAQNGDAFDHGFSALMIALLAALRAC